MNSSGVPGNIHALSGRRASINALWSGHVGERNATSPYPERNVRRSRVVSGRFAGTVSLSSLSSVRSTFLFASSGRNASTGSSSRSLHSSMRIIAATAVIGFVTEAKRKIVSRRIGAVRSKARVPIASTCSAPRRLMSATRPGSRALSTWRSRVSCILASRAEDSPSVFDRCVTEEWTFFSDVPVSSGCDSMLCSCHEEDVCEATRASPEVLL
jgi:hypothetical protein